MPKPPAFMFYTANFSQATAAWTNEEVGIYIRLLSYQWDNGSIPADYEMLARILRISSKKVDKILKNVFEKFDMNEAGNLINLRLEAERTKQVNYRETQAKHGKRGADIRYGKM